MNLNNAGGLQKTIDSVFQQTYTDYEYLIIDGGSTDGSRFVIEQHAHRLSYWISEPDGGIYPAMNKGIERAKGAYCLFLNSGDWLVNEYVLEQCFGIRQTADVLIGGCQVSKNGSIVHTYTPSEEITLQSFYEATIPHQSTFIKKTLFDRVGMYTQTYRIHGDYEFWIRAIIIHHCSVSLLKSIVADYNLEGLSNSAAWRSQSKEEVYQILRLMIPERVLADYASWKAKKSEQQLWDWVKSKYLIYKVIRFAYLLATRMVALKRGLKPPKSDRKND
ncbi:glycosyltransferase family 2 protein [Larkinella harenae]